MTLSQLESPFMERSVYFVSNGDGEDWHQCIELEQLFLLFL